MSSKIEIHKNRSILVVFGDKLPKLTNQYDKVLDAKKLQEFIEPGSIYEASAFIEELSRLTLPDGSSLSKSFVYKGYELWWIHYDSIYRYFCLPYTQYKKLLVYLKTFETVYFYKAPYKSLFSHYLKSYGCKVHMLREPGFTSPTSLPFGIFLQILLTLLCLPILMFKERRLMVFVGDKFEKSQDYDFRMKFIYKELRQRKIAFVEFIRSLESWKTVLQHFSIRRRPVIYSEAIIFLGKFASLLSGGRSRAKRKFGAHVYISETDPETRFKLMIATQYLLGIYDDIWAIRIMQWILRMIGVRAAFLTAAMERNFHSILGCKLNTIPTVGILHGVASRYYNGYDFLPGFDGEKSLSVDKYGLWSKWWKEYYVKNSQAYRPEQLHVSGPMRPLERKNISSSVSHGLQKNNDPIKVLLVPGELSNPKEIIPYLLGLMDARDISVYLTFRPYRDAFENWIKINNPQILEKIGIEKILVGNIHEAIAQCDVVVGSYSTGTLEALLQLKPLVFFNTNKWGDYFNLREYDNGSFFAENIEELIDRIKKAMNVSVDIIQDLQERYFGDPYKNGSKWVVDQLEDALLKGYVTK